jgi:hypothetical protein
MVKKATCLVKFQGSKWPTETPYLVHTQTQRIQGRCGSVSVQHGTIFGATKYEELLKTVNNGQEGYLLRKIQREQMTHSQRRTPFFPHMTQRSQGVVEVFLSNKVQLLVLLVISN